MTKLYKEFIFEVENFYMSQFFRSGKIDKVFNNCINIILSPDSKRGVIAYHSKYGQGKTFFFKVLHSTCKRVFNVNIYSMTSAKELVDIYKSGGEKALLEVIGDKNLFIDDIGDELDGGKAKSYGNSMNVLRYVILKRYELWEAKGYKLHGTTNLGLTQLADSYGGRVADRMSQMNSFEEFDILEKGSFRQVKTLRPLTEVEKQVNRDKLIQKEEVIEVDVKAYINELLQDPEVSIEDKDIYFFGFIKTYLENNNLIKISEPTIDDLAVAEWHARKSVKNKIRTLYRHTSTLVRGIKKDEALLELNKEEFTRVAGLIQVKKLLLKMKRENTKFL